MNEANFLCLKSSFSYMKHNEPYAYINRLRFASILITEITRKKESPWV